LALMRAAALEAECRLLAVTNGMESQSVAGAARSVADWTASGRSLDLVHLPLERRRPAPRERGVTAFRPCVFVWDVGGDGANRAALTRAKVQKDKRLNVVQRTSRFGRDGSCVVAPTLEDAIRLGEALAGEGVRVVCDFGAVLGNDLEPDAKLVARLRAGSDMPGFPTGRSLATQNFAAQAMTEFGPRLTLRSVGRTEESRDAEGARRRSGLPVYRLALNDAE